MTINKRSIIAMAVVFLFAACGEAPEKAKENEVNQDEMHEDSADHDHDALKEADSDAAMLDIPVGAKVYFGNLEDGQTVTSPVKIEFRVDGMQVEPAAELHENKGHHHLIINGSFLKRGTVVPADSVNIHYGKGQTETEIDLPKGEHTLTLQFADGYHQSYGQQMSSSIKVVVE